MTPSQEKAIESLKQRFPLYSDLYEVKDDRVDVIEDCGVIFFFWETGLIGDEDTMASVYGRNRHWFKIGKRGHVESYNGKSSKWEKNVFCTW